ncbi:hypothetical protein KP509_06G048700 [Ceratopteris richardii]|nr:hypothetical protein KP509_06G048700 [Ceratopteris richardii]
MIITWAARQSLGLQCNYSGNKELSYGIQHNLPHGVNLVDPPHQIGCMHYLYFIVCYSICLSEVTFTFQFYAANLWDTQLKSCRF